MKEAYWDSCLCTDCGEAPSVPGAHVCESCAEAWVDPWEAAGGE